MRKNVFGRQFSRDTNQRKQLFRSLISALIFQESIQTTLEKAKAIRGEADKIISKAKRGDEKLVAQLLKRDLGVKEIEKVIKEIAPRFKKRNSGFTRILRLERRFSDNAKMAIIEWVDKKEFVKSAPKTKAPVKELSAGRVEKKTETKKAEITKEKIKKTKKEVKK